MDQMIAIEESHKPSEEKVIAKPSMVKGLKAALAVLLALVVPALVLYF